ncbi:MAG: peptidylprolyl isomerase [Bacteroidetes bacterium]|nr:MAG: peptidylprolyl isomerase [Bacteroidota bacterium]
MKSVLAAIFIFSLSLVWSQSGKEVVMEIDGEKVSKSEFLQIYLKNNPSPKYDKASLDEYMELFRKFKLKVAEAEALGYDSIPRLRRELEGYRKSLSMPYMVDGEKNDELVKEAYERMKIEINASHILIKVAENASSADTLKAYNRILALKKRIEKGESFENVASGPGGSEDPSVRQNKGNLGYFTAFQMVYPFEEAAYNTPVGQISNPVRTRFGYHILKVHSHRPARGTITVGHIMIAKSKDDTEADRQAAKKKAQEIYEKLKGGASFDEMAKLYSDDYNTNTKGGVLPPFGTGTSTRMLPEFEEAAFALKEDNDISKPIETEYGIHIIKRTKWKGLASFESMERELKNKVKRDIRSKRTQDIFVGKLKKEYGYKDLSAKRLKKIYPKVDSTYFEGAELDESLRTNKVMFVLDGKKFPQKKFISYLQANHKGLPVSDIKDVVNMHYKNWVKQCVLDYEDGQLEDKYPEFKALMKEYHDGILLYEVMTDKVWEKANKDTSGLKSFHTLNASKYTWKDRVEGTIYECKNQFVAMKVQELLKEKKDPVEIMSEVNAQSELNLRMKNGRFEIEETPALKGQKLKLGVNGPYMTDDKHYVVVVDELIPLEMKTFEEAKGAITSDYQEALEKEWLDELEKKHTVVINKDVLYSIGR